MVIKPITEAFRDIFPPTTAEQLHNLTEGLLKFTEKLTLSATASENLKNTFKGLFAILVFASGRSAQFLVRSVLFLGK